MTGSKFSLKLFLHKLHILLAIVKRDLTYSLYIAREWAGNLVTQLLRRKQSAVTQSVLEWELDWPTFESSEQLEIWLQNNDIQFSTGHWAIYMPPQPELDRIIGEVRDFYPSSVGYKILRNFGPPDQALYSFSKTRNVKLLKRLKRRGSTFDNLRNANFLYTHGLGPRCWDLTSWRTSKQSFSVFVVDHVWGTVPSEDQHRSFLCSLRNLEQSGLLDIVVPGQWENHIDFRVPSCNGNLLYQAEAKKLQYVDFQNLVVNSRLWSRDIIQSHTDVFHFGNKNPLTRREFLYQSVPGYGRISKRNINDRWRLITSELQALGILLQNRLVLDIGCNQGMMMLNSLFEGATWCLGWDRPEVVTQSTKLLMSLGASRFEMMAANLSMEYPLKNDIPSRFTSHLNEAVVFFLSMRKHVGIMQDLATLPWRVLVYEGHQGDDISGIPETLAPLINGQVELRRTLIASDGPGRTNRPVAFLVRKIH